MAIPVLPMAVGVLTALAGVAAVIVGFMGRGVVVPAAESFCDPDDLVDFGFDINWPLEYGGLGMLGTGFLALVSGALMAGGALGKQRGLLCCSSGLSALCIVLFLAAAVASTLVAVLFGQNCSQYECADVIAAATTDITRVWQTALDHQATVPGWTGTVPAELKTPWKMTCPNIHGGSHTYWGEVRYCYACELPDDPVGPASYRQDDAICANQYPVICGGAFTSSVNSFAVVSGVGLLLAFVAAIVPCAACCGCCPRAMGLEEQGQAAPGEAAASAVGATVAVIPAAQAEVSPKE